MGSDYEILNQNFYFMKNLYCFVLINGIKFRLKIDNIYVDRGSNRSKNQIIIKINFEDFFCKK